MRYVALLLAGLGGFAGCASAPPVLPPPEPLLVHDPVRVEVGVIVPCAIPPELNAPLVAARPRFVAGGAGTDASLTAGSAQRLMVAVLVALRRSEEWRAWATACNTRQGP